MTPDATPTPDTIILRTNPEYTVHCDPEEACDMIRFSEEPPKEVLRIDSDGKIHINPDTTLEDLTKAIDTLRKQVKP